MNAKLLLALILVALPASAEPPNYYAPRHYGQFVPLVSPNVPQLETRPIQPYYGAPPQEIFVQPLQQRSCYTNFQRDFEGRVIGQSTWCF
jgi:hypothetical protein